jgi:hypothetical protein
MVKKIIVLLLFVPCLLFAQRLDQLVFKSTDTDTVTEADSQDTVAVRISSSGGGSSPFINLAQEVNSSVYITAAEKAAETTNVYNLAAESWWTRANAIEVRITSPANVITSSPIWIGHLEGSITLFIAVDTLSTYTDYGASRIVGD